MMTKVSHDHALTNLWSWYTVSGVLINASPSGEYPNLKRLWCRSTRFYRVYHKLLDKYVFDIIWKRKYEGLWCRGAAVELDIPVQLVSLITRIGDGWHNTARYPKLP